MTTGTGPKRDRGDAKALILARAVQVVEEGGEPAVRVNDIARDCAVSITSLYHFFGSREGLIEAVQAVRYEQFSSADIDSFALAMERCASAKDFRALVVGSLELFFSDPERARLRHQRLEILGSAAYRPNLAVELGKRQDAYNRRLSDVLGAAQRKGWIRPEVDLVAFSAFFLGVMNARVVIEVGDQSVDLRAWNAMAIDLLTRVLVDE
jgi:AcrR family transcriptional regulator